MAYRTLIFGVDDLFPQLQPFYMQEVQRGFLDIVAYAVFENNSIRLVTPEGRPGDGERFELAIISSHKNFYERMKFLESQGVPRNRIIDGRVLKVPNLDFPRLLKEGIAYGIWQGNFFSDNSFTIYPRYYKIAGNILLLGIKSYIDLNCVFYGEGIVSI